MQALAGRAWERRKKSINELIYIIRISQQNMLEIYIRTHTKFPYTTYITEVYTYETHWVTIYNDNNANNYKYEI